MQQLIHPVRLQVMIAACDTFRSGLTLHAPGGASVSILSTSTSTQIAQQFQPTLQQPTARVHLQVMIAACDTFRSGAVEQLKTHCMRLGVPLYERGYEKDPAKVAFEAAKAAERSKIDVLLVDTAGAKPAQAQCVRLQGICSPMYRGFMPVSPRM